MITSPKTQPIDLDLRDQVCNLIPDETWHLVRDTIVGNIVDNMPGYIVLKLTGKADNFEKAEEILTSYYEIPQYNQQLIEDAFKILGAEDTMYLLDSLQLEKYIESKQQSIDSAPCSIDPQ